MGLLFSSKQSSHQTKPNNKKLTSTGFKQQRICTPRLPQQGTKSSTKKLAPTDPILGPENLLKTGFAQKASLVAFPVAISHKFSLTPKHYDSSSTLMQKTLLHSESRWRRFLQCAIYRPLEGWGVLRSRHTSLKTTCFPHFSTRLV